MVEKSLMFSLQSAPPNHSRPEVRSCEPHDVEKRAPLKNIAWKPRLAAHKKQKTKK